MNKRIANLYIHVPFCDGKCIYCSFYSINSSDRSLTRSYISALSTELGMRAHRTGDVRLETLYIGGGTPTVLSTAELTALLTAVTDSLDLTALTEFTVEANPGTLTPEKTATLLEYGVNRLSIGAQSFDDRMLELLRRRHNASEILAAVRTAREAGFSNISIDLIAGLPGVSPDEWDDTLAKAIDLSPEHMSVYCLTVEEKTKLGDLTASGEIILPDNAAQTEALDTAMATLSSAGYSRYEISNYSKPGRECRHNTDFWKGNDYLGIGASAASRLQLERIANLPDISGYIAALDSGRPAPAETEILTPEKDACERLAFMFRMTAPVDVEAFIAKCGMIGTNLKPHWLESLHRLKTADLVSHKGSFWQLTAKGINFADQVCEELLVD